MNILLAIPIPVYCAMLFLAATIWFAVLALTPVLTEEQRDEIAGYEHDFKHVDRVTSQASAVRARAGRPQVTSRPSSEKQR